MKVCRGCPERGPQPLTNFSPDRRAPLGVVARCRECVALRKRTGRKAERKPNVIVRRAVSQPRTFQEIARITGYSEDMVSDILAALWDQNEVKVDRETRRWMAA